MQNTKTLHIDELEQARISSGLSKKESADLLNRLRPKVPKEGVDYVYLTGSTIDDLVGHRFIKLFTDPHSKNKDQ